MGEVTVSPAILARDIITNREHAEEACPRQYWVDAASGYNLIATATTGVDSADTLSGLQSGAEVALSNFLASTGTGRSGWSPPDQISTGEAEEEQMRKRGR